MKKALLPLIALLCSSLTGCLSTTDLPKTEPNTLSWSITTEIIETTENPLIEKHFLEAASPWYDIFSITLEESNQFPDEEGVMTGAVQYSYTYPDLKLKITTPPFLIKNPDPQIFTREGNIIAYGDEVIKYYAKDSNTDLLSVLQEKHINSWCKAVLEEEIFDDLISGNYNKEAYQIRPQSGGFDSRKIECYPDDEDHEDYMANVIYFESQDKTSYYKLRMNDGCAPWPCSIFAKIETLQGIFSSKM